MINHVQLSGTINISQDDVRTPEGVFTELLLFTNDWWHDRLENPHMFHVRVLVPMRVSLELPTLQDGMTIRVDGRLTRWSVGERYDRRSPATGIEAEHIEILAAREEGKVSRSTKQRRNTRLPRSRAKRNSD